MQPSPVSKLSPHPVGNGHEELLAPADTATVLTSLSRMAVVSLTPVNNGMGSECFLRHSDQSAWVQPHSPLGPCPVLWISEEGSRKGAQSPPPRHENNWPLSGPLLPFHQASQSRSFSYVFLLHGL